MVVYGVDWVEVGYWFLKDYGDVVVVNFMYFGFGYVDEVVLYFVFVGE